VRLILAVLLAILALLVFGALSAAAPMAHYATSHSAIANGLIPHAWCSALPIPC
jgi:hypothetical protein